MRARYSAFVMTNEQFLLDTWHPSRRPSRVAFAEDQTWLGLTVANVQEKAAELAEVEFIARSRIGQAKAIRHHERSRFIREGGIWFYLDGLLA